MRKIFALTGFARSGKDTLYKGFERACESVGMNCVRVAFADCLKEDIDPFLLSKLGISAWTEDNEEKFIIRPLLVEYGRAARKLDPLVWAKQAEKKIDNDDNSIYIVTDTRYLNELQSMRNTYSTDQVVCVYVNNEDAPAANEEERESIRVILETKGTVNKVISWANMDEEELKIQSIKLATEILWENGEL